MTSLQAKSIILDRSRKYNFNPSWLSDHCNSVPSLSSLSVRLRKLTDRQDVAKLVDRNNTVDDVFCDAISVFFEL